MNGSTIARALGALLLVVLAVAIGAALYQTGVNVGAQMAQAAAQGGQPGAAPVEPGPYAWHGYGYGWGGGFGFPLFGILFWILGIVLIIGLVRALFGWGRWGRGGSGGGPGGPAGWGGPNGGGGGPNGDRRRHLEELHRELHRNDPPAGAAGSAPPSPI